MQDTYLQGLIYGTNNLDVACDRNMLCISRLPGDRWLLSGVPLGEVPLGRQVTCAVFYP